MQTDRQSLITQILFKPVLSWIFIKYANNSFFAYLHKTASIRLLFDVVLTNLEFLYSSARHRKRERPGMALAI